MRGSTARIAQLSQGARCLPSDPAVRITQGQDEGLDGHYRPVVPGRPLPPVGPRRQHHGGPG